MIAIATLVSGIAILMAGFRLYLLDRSNQMYRLFFLITFLFAALHICWYELEQTQDIVRALQIKRITGFWTVLMAFLFCSFWVYAEMDKQQPWRKLTPLVFAMVIAPGLVFWYMETSGLHPFGTYILDPESGRWMLFYDDIDSWDLALAVWRILVFSGIVLLVFKAWSDAENPHIKNWLKYMLGVIGIAVALSLIQTLFIPLQGVPSMVNEALTTSVGILLYAWALSGFRLLDIRPDLAMDQILNSMTNLMILVSPDGVIRFVNPAAETFFGQRKEALIGTNIDKLFGASLHLNATNAEFSAQKREFSLSTNGISTYLLLNVMPVYKRGKILSGYACIGTDLSAYKAAEQQIRHGNIALRQSNLLLEEFIRSASHDLKEPLRSVNIYANLLQRTASEDDKVGYHKRIGRALKHMDQLLDSMLEVSSLSNNSGTHTSVDIEQLIARIRTRLNPIIEKRQGELIVNVATPLEGDAEKLELLFQHLLQNAFQHNEKEHLKVHVRCEKGEGGMMITIEDDGFGIPLNFQQRIFQMFRRSPADNQPDQGLGVGLTTARLIAEQHEGTIDLISSGENGTTFKIWFPLVQKNKENFAEALEV